MTLSTRKTKSLAVTGATAILVSMTWWAAPPADARPQIRACVTVARVPVEMVSGNVLGRGRVFCVGWSNNRIRNETKLEYLYGRGDNQRWGLAPRISSTTGPTGSEYRSPAHQRGYWRTRSRTTVLDNNGIVVKRYGWDQSAKVEIH